MGISAEREGHLQIGSGLVKWNFVVYNWHVTLVVVNSCYSEVNTVLGTVEHLEQGHE